MGYQTNIGFNIMQHPLNLNKPAQSSIHVGYKIKANAGTLLCSTHPVM